ncbi:MAG: molybdopterin-dependent oxidoreductase [Planctomycetota bacterium]
MVASNEYRIAKRGSVGSWLDSELSRRTFIKVSGILAGGAVVGSVFFRENEAQAANFGNPVLVETDPRVEIKYSVCQGCHGRCGMRCKVVDGVLVKIDGNPYNPCNMESHLAFETEPSAARLIPATMCAKGLAGMQSLYDPYRLKEPLKRVGPRGSGQWEVITWEQAFSEIGTKLAPYRDLQNDIDPNALELGKRVNQIMFSGGRNQQSRFTDLFWKNIVGTANARHDHTSICEESHHTAHELLTGNGIEEKFKDHTKPDLANAEFVLWFGSDPCSANFPFVPIARKLINMLERGGKLYVVDPRCNVAASKGKWVPIRPGTDATLALAIGRYIIDNNLYNAAFLRRPHDGAANPGGELNVSDATLLVKIVDGHPLAFLRADEAGIPDGLNTEFVVWSAGAGVKFNTVDSAELLPGQVTVNGVICKTAFELYVERVREQTIDEYAALCGVDVTTIQTIAQEFVASGRHGNVTMYRGPVQHTNGTYTGLTILSLNLLLGNFNWKGGLAFGGGGFKDKFDGAPFDPNTFPGKVTEGGIPITRVGKSYESSTEFAASGYPARRPWFPIARHYNFQEIIPSIEDGYPYAIKALILYWNGLPYSTPGARDAWERVVADESKIDLLVAIDIAMGVTAAWADYVLPDTTYFERWTAVTVAPTILTKLTGVRQPVVGATDSNMNYTGILPNAKTLEDILIGIGNAMGLSLPWTNAWDFWRQIITNIATDSTGPGLDAVLARGGRFANADTAYDGETLKNRFSTRLYFFSEKLAKTRDSITGAYFDGIGKYEPIADVAGNSIHQMDAAFPLIVVTYKYAWHTQMHTIRYPWLVSIQPENFIEINSSDASARGIRTGDEVKLASVSAPNGVIGRAKVTDTVCPGVVAVSHHFGHREMSSRPYQVNGVNADHDPTRGKGVQANEIMRLDPHLRNVTLQDKIGASASFSDTRVQVTKV